MPINQLFIASCFEQSNPKRAIGEHPSKRAFMRLGLKINPARFHLIGHRDAGDGAAMWLQSLRKANIVKKVPAGGRDGGGASIKTLGGQFSRICPVDDMAGQALAGSGEGQGHPDQPSAKN